MRLDNVKGVEISICGVNGPLTEYCDEDADRVPRQNEGVRYVEAVAGSNFLLRFSYQRAHLLTGKADSIRMKVYLDGEVATNRVWVMSEWPSNDYTKDIDGIRSTRQGKRYLQKFRFASLETNDDSNIKMAHAKLKQLGEVKVELVLVKKVASVPHKKDRSRYTANVPGSVPEKCLKGQAISQRVTLDEAESKGAAHTRQLDVEYPYGHQPFGTFLFRYRSKRDLQIHGIIARDPLPNVASIPAVTPDHKVKTEVKPEKRGHHSITLDGDDEDDDKDEAEVLATREVGRRKRQRRVNQAEPEVLDLTGYD